MYTPPIFLQSVHSHAMNPNVAEIVQFFCRIYFWKIRAGMSCILTTKVSYCFQLVRELIVVSWAGGLLSLRAVPTYT
jgi:hypothetical protein